MMPSFTCVETTAAHEKVTPSHHRQNCHCDVCREKNRERIVVMMDCRLLTAVHRLNSPSGQSMVD
jgi:hypothetical protein